MDKTPRVINALLAGAIVATVFVVVITIAGELYAPLKNILKEQHYHHWVGKSIWSVIFFVITAGGYYVVMRSATNESTVRLIRILSWMVVFSALALFIFFVYEFFMHV